MAEKVLGEHRLLCKLNSKDWLAIQRHARCARCASLAQAPDVL